MKAIFLTSLLVAASSPAFAKLTVFNTTDAIKFVLDADVAMEKILGATLRESEITSITASSSGDGVRKNLIVRIGTSSKSGINGSPCVTDVSVSTATRLTGAPGGRPGISSNRLVISNISAATCAP